MSTLPSAMILKVGTQNDKAYNTRDNKAKTLIPNKLLGFSTTSLLAPLATHHITIESPKFHGLDTKRRLLRAFGSGSSLSGYIIYFQRLVGHAKLARLPPFARR